MKGRTNLVFFMVTLVFQRGACESRRHTFIANTNFDNPDRWADHGYPCAGDTIEFEANKVVSIFVQTDAAISEMILPMNSEFIFDNDVTWGVNRDLAPCAHEGHSHVVHFTSDADDWYKPSNWQTYDENNKLLDPQDLLDIEQVPCSFDSAEFLISSSFTTEISVDTDIKKLTIWNEEFDTAGFSNYKANEGKYRVIGNGKMQIDGTGCQDVSGCTCEKSTNMQAALSRICLNKPCSTPSCLKPISAIGNCCPSCGSMLEMNYTSSYTEQAMRDFVTSIITKSEYEGCHAAISKVSSDMMDAQQDVLGGTVDSELSAIARLNDQDEIQIYITDEETDSHSGEIAKKLADEIYAQLSSPDNSLGVSSIVVQSSGPGQDLTGGLSAGVIAGIVIGVLFGILIIIGIALYVLRSNPLIGKKYRMTFTLYDKDTENHGHEMFPSVTEVGPGPEFESTDDNPRNPKASKNQQHVDNIRSALDSDFGVSFGNPAYEEDDM